MDLGAFYRRRYTLWGVLRLCLSLRRKVLPLIEKILKEREKLYSKDNKKSWRRSGEGMDGLGRDFQGSSDPSVDEPGGTS